MRSQTTVVKNEISGRIVAKGAGALLAKLYFLSHFCCRRTQLETCHIKPTLICRKAVCSLKNQQQSSFFTFHRYVGQHNSIQLPAVSRDIKSSTGTYVVGIRQGPIGLDRNFHTLNIRRCVCFNATVDKTGTKIYDDRIQGQISGTVVL